jgi:hypothetical protein
MAFLNLSSEASRYKLVGQMKGHTDSVHSVAMTKSGRILASGGELLSRRSDNEHSQHQGSDGVRLWEMGTHAQLPTPNLHHVRGQASCVLWVTRKEATEETLCFGTGLGYIVFWGQRPKRVSISPQAIYGALNHAL